MDEMIRAIVAYGRDAMWGLLLINALGLYLTGNPPYSLGMSMAVLAMGGSYLSQMFTVEMPDKLAAAHIMRLLAVVAWLIGFAAFVVGGPA